MKRGVDALMKSEEPTFTKTRPVPSMDPPIQSSREATVRFDAPLMEPPSN
jgi:hypothetical protein